MVLSWIYSKALFGLAAAVIVTILVFAVSGYCGGDKDVAACGLGCSLLAVCVLGLFDFHWCDPSDCVTGSYKPRRS